MKLVFSALSLSLFLLTSGPSAQAEECGVPVCDIPAAMERLRGASQAQRANFAKDLRTAHRGTEEAAILENLKAASDAAKALFVELKEEDWVIREAGYLGDLARVGLIKIAPVSAAALSGNFDGITEDPRRFEAIAYWVTAVEKLSSPQELQDLTIYGQYAKDWAIRTKQEDYFAREADKLIQAAARMLTLIFPIHEGAYDLKLSCRPSPEMCGEFLKMNQLTIIETLGNRGLVVAFGNREAHQLNYIYTNSTFVGDTKIVKSGMAPNWVRPSEAVVQIEGNGETISGTLRDVTLDGVIHFKGRPRARPLSIYQLPAPPAPIAPELVEGRFRGKLGSLEGDLTVQRHENDKWVGAFVSKRAGGIRKIFQLGNFDAVRGVLTLTNQEAFITSDSKLVLRLTPSDRQTRLSGIFLLSSGEPLNVDLVKVKP